VKSPGFTLVAMLSLALGIGANVSIFSLVNTILLRPLPVERPDQIVSVFPSAQSASGVAVFSYPNYVDFRDRNEVFSGLITTRFAPISLSVNGKNERVWGYMVSGNYFDVLGVKPILGRSFTPEEDRERGAHPVVVLSYACWKGRFGGDSGIVDRTVILNGRSFTVIGVAPEGFQGTELVFAPEMWAPISMQSQIDPGMNWLDRRGDGRLFVVGRLKDGISRQQAQVSLNVLAAQLGREYPDTNEGQTIQLSTPGLVFPGFRGPTIGFAGVLAGAVGLLLLIACTNLANLLLARATARRKEIAIRLALGASRRRLIRQLVTESVMLSLVGGVVGIALAKAVVDVVVALRPPIDFPLVIDLSLDWRVLGFALILSVLTGIVFGLAPALQATRPDVYPSLKDETSAAGFKRSMLRNGLVVAQIALSLILLVAAGLVVRSLQSVRAVGPGFETERALAMSVDLGLQGYDKARGQEFYRQLVDGVESVPGVKSVSLMGEMPLSLNMSSNGIFIEGAEQTRGANTPEALYSSAGVRYFETMGIPILQGREFGPTDKEGAPRVVVVNETFARRFWPGVDSVVGKRVSFKSVSGPFMEVVGVAKDGKYFSLGEDPKPFIYLPLAQSYTSSATLVVKTISDPQTLLAAIRSEVQRLDPNMPVFGVKTLNEHLSLTLFPMRIGAGLVGSFGTLALILAAIGVYGVMTYAVSQRTREIGIRMSLGAGSRDVLVMIVRQGMILAGIGLGIGLALALVLSRLMSNVLYGVSATDPMTFASVPVLLVAVVLLSCFVPARRAARVDPIIALRHE
jgi:putative ABC transport system permease protein